MATADNMKGKGHTIGGLGIEKSSGDQGEKRLHMGKNYHLTNIYINLIKQITVCLLLFLFRVLYVESKWKCNTKTSKIVYIVDISAEMGIL